MKSPNDRSLDVPPIQICKHDIPTATDVLLDLYVHLFFPLRDLGERQIPLAIAGFHCLAYLCVSCFLGQSLSAEEFDDVVVVPCAL